VVSSRWILKPFINEWRKKHLGLPPTYSADINAEQSKKKFPVFYAYSDAVFPKPADWPEWYHVTGYWFLDRSPDWQPPADLVAFLADGPPPVYVGFSSVNTRKVQGVTDLILEALVLTKQRGILAAGWSSLQGSALPKGVFTIESIPHNWLFPQVAAAIHHGGAGTTAAGLRAGIPNIIIPFAFDNPFWAWRVTELGVSPPGIPHKELGAKRLAHAIDTAIHDEEMKARRVALSQQICKEDGVARAVELFHQFAL